MKSFIKVLLGCFYGILIFFIIITFSYFYQVAILNKSYANIFGYSLFTVQSGSMKPTIQIDDGIIIKINDSFEKDDIIVYQDNSMLIAHRVVNIDGNEITTKGDGNNTEDVIFDKSMVVGKVIKIIPKLRRNTKFNKKSFIYKCCTFRCNTYFLYKKGL